VDYAKPAVDIGYATNALDPATTFWAESVGLGYEELLKVGNGIHQHRYALHGAVLKLNSHRHPLHATGRSGFEALRIAADVDAPVALVSPDDLPVTLVPAGTDGITATEVTFRTAHHAQVVDLFGALSAVALGGDRFAIGETTFVLVDDPSRPPTPQREVPGIAYLTVQIFDVVRDHAALLAAGFTEGLAPLKLGTTAHVSFVLFPDGDWLEISQRASLTGPI
jgi:hypothetical protein